MKKHRYNFTFSLSVFKKKSLLKKEEKKIFPIINSFHCIISFLITWDKISQENYFVPMKHVLDRRPELKEPCFCNNLHLYWTSHNIQTFSRICILTKEVLFQLYMPLLYQALGVGECLRLCVWIVHVYSGCIYMYIIQVTYIYFVLWFIYTSYLYCLIFNWTLNMLIIMHLISMISVTWYVTWDKMCIHCMHTNVTRFCIKQY